MIMVILTMIRIVVVENKLAILNCCFIDTTHSLTISLL